jgi:UDP-glucose 4-epimerase
MNVVVVDSLGNSHYDTLTRIRLLSNTEETDDNRLYCVIGDLTNERDVARVRAALTIYPCDAIIHLAAWKSVSESVSKPDEYYRNNLGSLINVFSIMSKMNVHHLVFSSSATVYGSHESETTKEQLTEDSPCNPVNPYGRTKWIGELMCRDVAMANAETYQIIAARYMNPVGKHESGILPENPVGPPMNLFPIIHEVLQKKRDHLDVFGGDYKTRDGTAERDYVHVMDVAEAHVEMIQHMIRLKETQQSKPFDVINIGTGKGHTVLEVIFAMEKVYGLNSFTMASKT